MVLYAKDVMEKLLDYLQKVRQFVSSTSPGKERNEQARKIVEEAQKNFTNFCVWDPLLMANCVEGIEEGKEFASPLFGTPFILAKMTTEALQCKPELSKTLQSVSKFLKVIDTETASAQFMGNLSPSIPGQATQMVMTPKAIKAMQGFVKTNNILDEAMECEKQNGGLSSFDLVYLALQKVSQ